MTHFHVDPEGIARPYSHPALRHEAAHMRRRVKRALASQCVTLADALPRSAAVPAPAIAPAPPCLRYTDDVSHTTERLVRVQ